MDITFVGSTADASADIIGLGAGSDRSWLADGGDLVEALGEAFTRVLDDAEFEGKAGQSVSFNTGAEAPHTVVALGVGDDPDDETIRQAAGALGRKATKAVRLATTLAHGGRVGPVVEGVLLSQYTFNRYLSDPKEPSTESLVLVADADPEAATHAEAVARATMLARDLINTPAADKAPSAIEELVASMAADTGLRLVVHDREALVEGGFGGVLGVAAGSDRPPRLLEMWHEPDGADAFVVLVGKGITFDSGGLSLKPASNMETMKTDMSGAAAVIGAMQAIAALDVPVRVLGLTPLTDNMPGPLATKPGDVLTTRNGKTIEVLNTDAEGRLVLADALALGVEQEPDLMVDVATLTGACKVALGEKIGGAMGTDEALIQRIIRLGAQAGERFWHLPLPDDYRTLIDTPIADMKNTGGRWGGALTAGLLLKEFVGEVPWVHLDVAGPARWPDAEHYQAKGGSGFAVRTLVSLVEDVAAQGV